jgi:hypothetical protein
MGMDLQTLLPMFITAFPFGIGVLVLGILYYKRSKRFFFKKYQGNSMARFMDILIGNVFFGLALGCLITVMFIFQESEFIWQNVPYYFLVGAFIIPIGIVGAYWRSFITNKMWGGFMPMARAMHGQSQVQSAQQIQIDSTKVKLPRRTRITAIVIALIVFTGMYLLLSSISWNINQAARVIIKLLMSGLLAFGTYMLIVTTSISRRIQRLKEGETIDDEYDF